MDHAELRRRLNESGLRLPDGSERLVEIGRHLTEIPTLRLRRQTQRNTDLTDICQGFLHFSLRFRKDRLPSIIFFSRDRIRRQQLLRACEVKLCELKRGFAFFEGRKTGMQHGDPVVDVLNGVLQFPA